MAQVVKLKRSSTAGNAPTSGQMVAGELAMNTADGKLFLRDDSDVRPIVTVDNEVTGSINLTGNISASGNITAGDATLGATNITGVTKIQGDISIGPQGNVGPISGYTLSIRDVTPNMIFKDQSGLVGDAKLTLNSGVFTIGTDISDVSSPTHINFEMDGVEKARFTTSSFNITTDISASGAITSSDIYIDDWGSVSASLASAGGGGGAVATYTNGSNDRIITSTGTDGINGEANLTFDGSTLALNGNISSSGTSDNFFGGRIVLDNSKYVTGTETGGQTRNILSIDGSNVTQVANGNLETNIKGTSISIANDLTVTGKVTADFIDMGEGTLSSAGDFGFGSTVFNRLGTLASTTAGKVYYLNGSWTETDADSASTSTQLLAVAVSTTSNLGMLAQGIIKMGTNTGFSGATTGDPLYLSTTSGQVTDTAPSGTGDIVRIVGYVVDAADGVIYFNPSQDWIEL